MFLRFPPGTTARAALDYVRPYPDPIAVEAGDPLAEDPAGAETTDLVGWVWRRGPDGRAGWTPTAWIETVGGKERIARDFTAIELTVRAGDRLTLLWSESGFAWARTAAGEEGWLPHGALALETEADPTR